MWLGIDLGGTNLRVGVVDGRSVVESVTVPSIPKDCSLDSSIDYLVEVIRPLCSSEITQTTGCCLRCVWSAPLWATVQGASTDQLMPLAL